ncbi:hypothetical protein [Rhodococcus marinonascens]|uniref:hypothetical protein n=1 Tax=Rhodococcus marinonascens TaxID=38311 RepID=UPI000933D79F|nr:hypothetical protein [Rhodococcus marinonascens]
MARITQPSTLQVRNFTTAELARIRELTAAPLPPAHRPGMTARQIEDELDAIHAAAGGARTFKIWTCGSAEHDPDAAFAEEIGPPRTG